MANLIVERGKEKGTTFELRPDTACVAGRDPSAVNFVISDVAASRRHFQVIARNGKWFVADLGSRNATYLNEEKVESEVELTTGDRIQVGETVVSFLDEEKSAADRAAVTQNGLNGKEIGGYEILERVGRGGMGTVFKARQVSLNRVIALKVLASRYAKDPKFVQKFQSEARAAGQLNHPNVVQVFDVGQAGGLHYFSMEFMECGCVQDVLTAAPEGRLPWKEALPMIIDATRGLVFAEKRGIIHRDIKPDNLMLTIENRVKIGDLGLAKHAEDQGGDTAIFGTPHYIAPEQAQGKEVSHAADLYALGTTFYRIVSGRTPFQGDSVREILKKQINDPHVPITQIVPDFPPDLSAIVDKLMAKKVEDRYQSATKLLEDLEAFQLAHQIELSGAKKLNKPLMIGAIVVAVAAVGVGIWYATHERIVKETQVVEKTKIVEKEPTGPVRTPEEEAQAILLNAKVARMEAWGNDKALGEISIAKEAAWLDVAKQYEDVVEKNADPRAAKETDVAKARATEIRGKLSELKRTQSEREAQANGWWEGMKKKLELKEKQKQWADAIRLAADAVKDPAAQPHFAIVKDAQETLRKVEAREVSLAKEDLEATTKDAQGYLDAGEDFQKAQDKMDAWASAIENSKSESQALAALAMDAREWVKSRREDAFVKLEERLDQDKQPLVDAFRALHQSGSSLYDFQFGTAASQLDAAAKAAKTWIVSDRILERARRLRVGQAGWEAWVQLFADGKVLAAGEELKGLPGSSKEITFKVNLKEKPTLEKFTVDRLFGSGTSKGTMAWAELSREELATIFVLPRAEKLPGETSYKLAWAFAELGNGYAAQILLDAAGKAGQAIDPAEEAALKREIAAIKDYEALRAKSLQNETPSDVVAAVSAWRQSAAGTDFYVVQDGRPARDLQILPAEDVQRFLDTLGRPKR